MMKRKFIRHLAAVLQDDPVGLIAAQNDIHGAS
jgi:hypothetical protein